MLNPVLKSRLQSNKWWNPIQFFIRSRKVGKFYKSRLSYSSTYQLTDRRIRNTSPTKDQTKQETSNLTLIILKQQNMKAAYKNNQGPTAKKISAWYYKSDLYLLSRLSASELTEVIQFRLKPHLEKHVFLWSLKCYLGLTCGANTTVGWRVRLRLIKGG